MAQEDSSIAEHEHYPTKEGGNVVDDNLDSATGEKAGTSDDQKNMRRMGKTQEFRVRAFDPQMIF